MRPLAAEFPEAEFRLNLTRLLQSRKERLLTSAIGLEFLCTRFFSSPSGS